MGIVTVAEGIVLAVIEELRGKPTDITARNIASTIAEKAEEAAIAAVQVEIRKYEAALGLVLAAYDVNEAVQLVVQRMHEAEAKPSLTDKLLEGVKVEEFPPGTDLDALPKDPES